MSTRVKDRIINLLLILLFMGIIAGSGYVVFKMMTRWSVKGLG
jgi:hypothetical protein